MKPLSLSQNFRNSLFIRTFFIFIIFCLALLFSFFYPAKDLFESILFSAIFFVLFPFLCMRLILHEKFSDFGFKAHISFQDILFFTLLFFFSFFFLFLFSRITHTENLISLPEYTRDSFWLFFLHFFLFIGSFTFFYEFLFRGFLQIGLSRYFHFWSIPIQLSFFFFFLFATETLQWETLPLIISSIGSSILIYRTHSLLFAFLFSWLFAILTSIVFVFL